LKLGFGYYDNEEDYEFDQEIYGRICLWPRSCNYAMSTEIVGDTWLWIWLLFRRCKKIWIGILDLDHVMHLGWILWTYCSLDVYLLNLEDFRGILEWFLYRVYLY
jgi:hypothetical protein